uniref:Transmembrane protein n=1 Tax=Lactuca sativa TaxID=4236 RepID=A0A9R1WIH4_LACSA|nr:hypothetical protein LSAT_V11C200099070 [Lactuca sativa]
MIGPQSCMSTLLNLITGHGESGDNVSVLKEKVGKLLTKIGIQLNFQIKADMKYNFLRNKKILTVCWIIQIVIDIYVFICLFIFILVFVK